MPKINELQPAFILHARAYRESSLLVDLFTRLHGRVTVIARGVKRPQSKIKGIMQPFIPLLISFAGRGELPTLRAVESSGVGFHLTSKSLLSGFYLNELLTKVLHRYDPHEAIYTIYEQTLNSLQVEEFNESILRKFEKKILRELGYELQITHEAETGMPIDERVCYFYVPERGCVNVKKSDAPTQSGREFLGKHLLSIAKDEYISPEILFAAKKLMRQAFSHLFDYRSLKSRELFIK